MDSPVHRESVTQAKVAPPPSGAGGFVVPLMLGRNPFQEDIVAHTNVKNTFVGVPKVNGGIWRVPQTIALPVNAWDPRPGSAIRLGGVSDEGYTYSTERQTDKKKDWNGDKVRSVQTSKDDTLELTFIEFLNPNVMSIAHGDANVVVAPATAEHGTHIAVRHVADVLDHGAYIIDTFDGKVRRRRCVYDAQPDTIDPIAEKPGDWSVYKIKFDLFPNSQGVTSDVFTELDDKLVPSEWDATIAGSAGTVIYTVTRDGVSQSTTGLAYNAATSALDTALEGLSLVGANGATVTGTAGNYDVTLVKGGVLSAVGSGGATATVLPAG